jgi:hypothetical protein
MDGLRLSLEMEFIMQAAENGVNTSIFAFSLFYQWNGDSSGFD